MTALAGTGALIGFILRRDRVRIPVWIIAIVGFVLPSVAGLPGIYATQADRQARAELMQNPVAVVLTGPGYGLDNYTFGAMTANEMFAFTAIVVALMSVLLVVRHTRAEEETGRAELVRAAVVGRHAATTATLVVVCGVNVVLGGLLAVGLPVALDELSMTGSLAFGAGMAAVGIVFTAVGAVAAQVSQHTRGATGIGAAALGTLYALRVAGDLGDGTLSWLSPFHWAQATRAYVDERWWPLLLPVALATVLIVTAVALSARRDVGAGLVAPRFGRPAASFALRGPIGLALRLQRASLIAWGGALFVFGLGYGTLGSEVSDFVAENEALADFISVTGGASVTDAFFATFILLTAMLVAGFAIQSALRVRGEETAGRAEPVLATAVSRSRWAAGHLTIAMIGGAAILVLTGLGFGITGAIATGDAALLPRLTGAALAHVPALWLVVGLATALFGLLPRAVALVWAVLAYGVTVGMFGGLLQFPGWTYELSPFGHTPQLPAENMAIAPLLVLTLIAAALVAAGLAGLHRRDVTTA